MSVARCREINARFRRAGVTVHEYPGCWSRGNGQAPAYEGGVLHHTASAFGMALAGTGIGRVLADGRSDLSGPLCNWADNVDGSLTFVAAFPANHAGASGGKSMGPLPVTNLFNKRVLGLEIVYPGDEPMTDAQYHTALVWSRVVADVVGFGNIARVRAHAETSITGKWDPGFAPGRTINMFAFRRAADIIGAPTPTPVEDDVKPRLCSYINSPSVFVVFPWGHWHLPNQQALDDFRHEWRQYGAFEIEEHSRTDWFGPRIDAYKLDEGN